MFSKLTNVTGKIKFALYGVKLNAQNFLNSHEYPHRDVCATLSSASLMTLLKTIPDIYQALLQFINVMNLVDLLLHFSPSFVVKPVHIYVLGARVW